MNRSVVVVGSLNMDLVVTCTAVPDAGQTIAGESFFTAPGGKGANQAVAAARLGATVQMVGCVGRDGFGRDLREALQRDGVLTDAVREVEAETGTAVILVEQYGENRIVVVAGANASVEPIQAGGRVTGHPPPIVVMQLEVPLATVEMVAEACESTGALVFLNAAPAQPLPSLLRGRIHHLIVNETEANALVTPSRRRDMNDLDDALWVAESLAQTGPASVTVTLGSRGAVHVGERKWLVEAPKMTVQDTTGAGDAFVGALAAAAAQGIETPQALVRAVAAGSLAVTRPGAQASLPHAGDVERLASTLQARSVA